MTTIELKQIRKTYDGGEVIKGLDLKIQDGEFMVLVGPSGCGKSTLLRMIAGLEEISDGDLLVDGKRVNDLSPSQRGGAMVFQNYALYPHMNVARNLGFALEVAGVKKSTIKDAVGRAAEILNISHLLDSLPKALSGGERQRVAIGRAIVRKPKFFLFDEPLSNLDAALRVQLRIELIRLHQELGSTMIYVTHDQVEAMTMGDRISILRKGILEQLGSPIDLYHTPVNTFVAGFLGSPALNLLSCEYRDGLFRIAGKYDMPCPAHMRQHAQDIVKLGFRPEDVAIDVEQGIPSTLVVSENLGDQCIIHSKVFGHDKLFTAKISSQIKIPLDGREFKLMPNLNKAFFFNKNDQAVY